MAPPSTNATNLFSGMYRLIYVTIISPKSLNFFVSWDYSKYSKCKCHSRTLKNVLFNFMNFTNIWKGSFSCVYCLLLGLFNFDSISTV